MNKDLTFEDALKIAQGCLDYSGGYRGDARMFEAYRDGIHTVIAALQKADRNGLADSQTRTLHAIGCEAQAVAADIAYNKMKNTGQLHATEAARTAREEMKWGEQ